MRQLLRLLILLIGVLSCSTLNSQCYDAVVSLSGEGDYPTVQEAIDAAGGTDSMPFRIFIHNGIYDEKLFFEKSHIVLIGESRDSTIITTAVLRRAWREENPDDWGAATVNIRNNVTDLTFANLTIQNNFADVFPDYPDPNDHSFAIRGGGHRIILYNCNVTSTGGDTVSLWNTSGGMFYHNRCYFEGYVDFLAPRGYCYITDSEFFGHNSTASIWHDGSGGEDHKFVIRNSVFDGVPGFALGRHHRDAQFYLLDSWLTENMKNQEIYWEARDDIQWSPDRKYYYNVHRPQFDWTWHRDNLHLSEEVQKPNEITAEWTFGGQWDPENELDGLLPFASLPSLVDNGCASTDPQLTWAAGTCVASHLLYLGIQEDSLKFYDKVNVPELYMEGLANNQTYYWKVDEINQNGDTIPGEIWSFRTTTKDDLPNKVTNPVPADSTGYSARLIGLTWDVDHCTTDSVTVYFGSDPDELELMGTEKYNRFFVSQLKDDSTYYWRVDAINDNGTTTGDVWSFTYNPSTTGAIDYIPSRFKLRSSPNPVKGTAYISFELTESGPVTLDIFSIDGRLLATATSFAGAGTHKEALDISPYSGILICRLSQGKNGESIHLVAQ